MTDAQYSLDIPAETRPLTFVKAKLLLENMAPGEVACIRLRAGEPLNTLPRTLRDQGHSVLELRPEKGGGTIFRLLVRKRRAEAAPGCSQIHSQLRAAVLT